LVVMNKQYRYLTLYVQCQKTCKKTSSAGMTATARVMPWRALKGRRPDPYHVWLSEIMLAADDRRGGGTLFREVRQEMADGAKSSRRRSFDDVLAAWGRGSAITQGRATCINARRFVAEMGAFPETVDELLELPGIGPYTGGGGFPRSLSIAQPSPSTATSRRVVSRFFRGDGSRCRNQKAFCATRLRSSPGGNTRPGDFTPGVHGARRHRLHAAQGRKCGFVPMAGGIAPPSGRAIAEEFAAQGGGKKAKARPLWQPSTGSARAQRRFLRAEKKRRRDCMRACTSSPQGNGFASKGRRREGPGAGFYKKNSGCRPAT